MDSDDKAFAAIQNGKVALGIEFGSTTIKAVLTTEDFQTIATGSYDWENDLVDGLWTYSLEDIWHGLQISYKRLTQEIMTHYHVHLHKIGAIGFSAMMHGYMVFDKKDELLMPFRTWRNATTEMSAQLLTQLFEFNIPQRWSIAHLYQAILNQENHVKDIDYMTTLAGYVHWRLTGERVLGIGDASGVFPIDETTGDYHQQMIDKFQMLDEVKKYDWDLRKILPKVLPAGASGGKLSRFGAKLIDPSGHLESGAVMAPPEGDAGTGMVATNSIRKQTGNVSVGTSILSMIVLERNLHHVYNNIDIVTTPTGLSVAMVHANNSSSDINAWANLFSDFATRIGNSLDKSKLYNILFTAALAGEPDAGGLLGYGYYSGENITAMPEGRPLLVRQPDSHFDVANLMRLNLYTAFGALKIGMRILEDENVLTQHIVAQGGLFKTPMVAQKLLAAALNVPITVTKTAGEGGPHGEWQY